MPYRCRHRICRICCCLLLLCTLLQLALPVCALQPPAWSVCQDRLDHDTDQETQQLNPAEDAAISKPFCRLDIPASHAYPSLSTLPAATPPPPRIDTPPE